MRPCSTCECLGKQRNCVAAAIEAVQPVKTTSHDSQAAKYKSSKSHISFMGTNNQLIIKNLHLQSKQPERNVTSQLKQSEIPVQKVGNSQSDQPNLSDSDSQGVMNTVISCHSYEFFFTYIDSYIDSTSVILLVLFTGVVISIIVMGFFGYYPLERTSETLPHLVSNFTGRKNETEELVKLLDFSSSSPDLVNIV